MAEVASKTTVFRRWGYLAARLDPLEFFSAASPPELDDKSPWSSEARSIYCGTIGADFMHIADPERREWIAARMEHPPAARPDQQRILERLLRAELFEQTLQARFV
jgi:2-oxoglutarate dehydrogenase E1 component